VSTQLLLLPPPCLFPPRPLKWRFWARGSASASPSR
jgi:hypothetical protein